MNKKFTQAITIIIGLFFTAGVLFFLMVFLQTPFENTFEFLDPILGVKSFRTSAKYQKTLGIEIANISHEEEKKLNGLIEKVINAQKEYYSTKKEENLDKVKDLYLSEEFERMKKETKNQFMFYPLEATEATIRKLKFSAPRAYNNLPGRIGIISLVAFNFNQSADVWPASIVQIFIFKNTDEGWNIEKQQVREGMVDNEQSELEAMETKLVKQIIDSQK